MLPIVGSREIAFDCKFFLGDRPVRLAQADRRAVHVRSLRAGRGAPADRQAGRDGRRAAIDGAAAAARRGASARGHHLDYAQGIGSAASAQSLRRRSAGARAGGARPPPDADLRSRHQPGRVEDQRRAGDRRAVRPERRIRAGRARLRAADQRRGAGAGSKPASSTTSSGRGRRPIRTAWPTILGLAGRQHRYVFELGADESARAQDASGVDRPRLRAAGHRPEHGRRRAMAAEAVARRRIRRARGAARRAATDVQFLLLGGPARAGAQRAAQGARPTVPLLDPGCDNTVRHFAALLEPLRRRRDRRHAGDAPRAGARASGPSSCSDPRARRRSSCTVSARRSCRT